MFSSDHAWLMICQKYNFHHFKSSSINYNWTNNFISTESSTCDWVSTEHIHHQNEWMAWVAIECCSLCRRSIEAFVSSVSLIECRIKYIEYDNNKCARVCLIWFSTSAVQVRNDALRATICCYAPMRYNTCWHTHTKNTQWCGTSGRNENLFLCNTRITHLFSLSLSLSAYFSVQNFAILSCIVARFQLLSCVWSCIFRRHFVCVFVFLFKCFKSIYSCIKISALSSRIMPWNWPSNKFWWCQSMVLHNISHKHTQHMSIVLYVGYERWFSFSPEYQIIPFVWIFWLYSYNSQNGQGRSIRSDCLCSFPVHSICLWWRGIATWTIHNA